MRNYLSFLLILLVLMITVTSCSSRKAEQESKIEIQTKGNLQNTETCISSELIKSLNTYLSDFQDDTYYKTRLFSVYFFQNNGRKYFNIWMSVNIPYYLIQNNPNTAFRFSLVKVLDAKILLITTDVNDGTGIFNCAQLTLDELKEKVNNSNVGAYDGSSYPQTFEYLSNDNGQLIINKADSLIVDFLGEEFIKYEKYLKNLKTD